MEESTQHTRGEHGMSTIAEITRFYFHQMNKLCGEAYERR